MRAWTVDADDIRVAEDLDEALLHLPSSNLLDKPIGDKIFGKDSLAFFAESSLPWSKIWLTAIAAATLEHLGRPTI
jgi:hypothetical protein